MDKEERKKLEKDYEEFWQKKAYGARVWKPMYISISASLIIFIIPTNLLTIYPILRSFTQFMATLFPNINVYAQRSNWPEVTEFYFSYMWIVLIVTIFFTISAIPKTNKEAEKYFGTGKYRGKEILPYRFIFVIQSFFNLRYIPYYLGTILLFGMFFIGNIFQNLSLCIIFMLNIIIVLNTIHIKKIRKEK